MSVSRSIFVVCLVLHLFFACHALQAGPQHSQSRSIDSAQASQWLREGDSLYEASRFNKATHLLEKAQKPLHQTGQIKDYYYCLNTLAKVWVRQQDFLKAETYLNKIIKELKDQPQRFPVQLGEAYNSLGYIYRMAPQMGDLAKAKKYYKKAISSFKRGHGETDKRVRTVYSNISALNHQMGKTKKAINYANKAVILPTDSSRTISNAQALNNLAQLYQYKGYTKKALELYKASLSIFKEIRGKNSYPVGVLYQNIGVLYKDRRSFVKAEDYIKKAHNILSTVRGKHLKTANGLANLALVDEWYGDRNKALENLHRAKAIYEDLGRTEEKGYCNILANIARNYREEGKYQKAFSYYNRVAKCKQDLKEGTNYHYLMHLGEAYRKVGKYDSAHYYQNRYMDSTLSNFGNNNYNTAIGFLGQSKTYEAEERYQKALQKAQQGLGACFQNFTWNSYRENPDLRDYDSWDVLFKLFNQKGYLLKKIAHSRDTIDTTDLRFAHQSFCRASHLIDTIKNRYQSRKTVHSVYKHANKAYEGAIETAFQLYNLTDEQYYKEIAYNYFGKNKSVLLRQNLQQSKARQFAGIPDSLVRKEKQLQEDISYLQSKLHQREDETLDSAQKASFEKRLIEAREKFRSLKKRFRKNYSDYYALMYKSDLQTIHQLQDQNLGEEEVVLEYFSGQNAYYYACISTDTSLIGVIEKDSIFQRALTKTLHIIKDPYAEVKEFIPNSHFLYKSLLGAIPYPLKEKKLHIIPDGRLVYLPFETLIQEKPGKKQKHFNYLKYVIYDYRINYVYVNSFLEENRNNKKSNAIQYLGFAPLFDQDGDTSSNLELTKLQGAKRELKHLSLIGKGETLEGKRASEKRFKEMVHDYNVVHMGTHGLLDQEYPMNSRLLLASSQNSMEDGKLYAWELFNMEVNAELAVLSACNTGRGKMVNGEGVLSLGRAFSYAGCKSLLISLWNLHDQVSVELMEQFYRFLDKGVAKDEALRQSKLSYLKSADGITARPYYWAGMVTIGNPAPIKEKSSYLRSTLISSSLILVILLIGGLLLYNRKL